MATGDVAPVRRRGAADQPVGPPTPEQPSLNDAASLNTYFARNRREVRAGEQQAVVGLRGPGSEQLETDLQSRAQLLEYVDWAQRMKQFLGVLNVHGALEDPSLANLPIRALDKALTILDAPSQLLSSVVTWPVFEALGIPTENAKELSQLRYPPIDPQAAARLLQQWGFPKGTDINEVQNTLQRQQSRDLTSWNRRYGPPELRDVGEDPETGEGIKELSGPAARVSALKGQIQQLEMLARDKPEIARAVGAAGLLVAAQQILGDIAQRATETLALSGNEPDAIPYPIEEAIALLEQQVGAAQMEVQASYKAMTPEAKRAELVKMADNLMKREKTMDIQRTQFDMEDWVRTQARALQMDLDDPIDLQTANAALSDAGYSPLGTAGGSGPNTSIAARRAAGTIASRLRAGSLTEAQADDLFGYIRTMSDRITRMDGMGDLINDPNLDPNRIIDGMAGLLPNEARVVAEGYLDQLDSMYTTRRDARLKDAETVRNARKREQDLRISARAELRRRDEDRATRALDLDKALMDARMGVFRDVTRDPTLLTPTGVGARIGGADIYDQMLASVGSVPAEFAEVGGPMVLPSVTPAFARAMSADEALNVPVTVEDILA